MDYEEQWEEHERVQPCEECEALQAEIDRLIVRVREVENSGQEYEKRKRRLNWAVEAQQRHQRQHEFEKEMVED